MRIKYRKRRKRRGNPSEWPRWSAAEKLFLNDNYSSMTARQIGAHLGRTYLAVTTRVKRMKLRKNFAPHSPWNKKEDAVLRASYHTVPQRKIAKRLGRTKSSVRARAFLLGLAMRKKKG